MSRSLIPGTIRSTERRSELVSWALSAWYSGLRSPLCDSANRAKGSRAKRPGAGSLEACKLSSRISARTFSAMGCVKISAMAS